jgi:branched-chain amino acid transport system substrate-binding protein
MKKLMAATAAAALLASTAYAGSHNEIKIGVILGFTGPLESITPAMGDGAELAMKEVTDSGKLLGGATVTSVRADSTCIDAAAATAAAERLVTADKVNAIMGADCSGVTGAILQNVARANGIVMVSPSATSPALSTAEDDGLFFRTAPSDARQGVVMTNILMDRGFKTVALTYTNNDYGKGLADSFAAAFKAAGGTVTINAAHDEDKADYSAEVGALASAGGDILVVAGYEAGAGRQIMQTALDTGAFDQFVLPDGMVGQDVIDAIGSDMNGSFGQYPGSANKGADVFGELAAAAGFEGTSAFAGESYDAAALIMLAMQAGGSSASADIMQHVMSVANAPGIEIMPGQLAQALVLLEAGYEIDYAGATAVDLIGPGESAGNYREIEIQNGKVETVGYR